MNPNKPIFISRLLRAINVIGPFFAMTAGNGVFLTALTASELWALGRYLLNTGLTVGAFSFTEEAEKNFQFNKPGLRWA